MATKTWTGAQSADSSDPANWTPSGVPQAGDSPVINSGTISLIGDNLNGDTLTATPGASIDVGAGSDLKIQGELYNQQPPSDPITVDLAAGGTADIAWDEYATVVVNATGGTLSSEMYEGAEQINIASGATLTAETISDDNAALTISGPGTLDVAGVVGAHWIGLALSPAAIIGNGTITGPGPVTIDSAVASGITLTMTYEGDPVVLDKPWNFDGAIVDTDSYPVASARTETVTLSGLEATSYTDANGVLTLYQGDAVEAAYRVQSDYTIAVSEDGKGDTVIWTGGITPTSGTSLAVHSSAPTNASNNNTIVTNDNNTVTGIGNNGDGGDGSSGGGTGGTGGSVTDPGATPTPGAPASSSPSSTTQATPTIPPVITGVDQTTGATISSLSPVLALPDDNDDLTITSSATNGSSINVGTGNNTIEVTGNANAVITSGVLSQIVLGSGSGDVVFLNDQNAPGGVSWDSVSGFASGDAIAIIGAGPANTAETQIAGSSPWSGLTFEDFTTGANGQTLASFVSMPGVDAKDVVIAYGHDPDLGGMSFALLVHA